MGHSKTEWSDFPKHEKKHVPRCQRKGRSWNMNIKMISWEVVELKPGLEGCTELKSAEKDEENISSRAVSQHFYG